MYDLIETVFVEINVPNRKNIIVGTIIDRLPQMVVGSLMRCKIYLQTQYFVILIVFSLAIIIVEM